MKLRAMSALRAMGAMCAMGAMGAALVLLASSAFAQVGKSLGVVDANTATEQVLVAAPNMSAPVVKALIAARPFNSIVDLNKFLLSQKLTQEQANQFYGKAFVHVNLNTGTAEEIMLIPGAGKRMAHEFEEYRPWRSWAQFQKEIGKYVNQQEVARLAQYTFIPVNINTASDADIQTIPGVGARMLHEFKEYRPWKSIEHFHKEIGKYVDEKEVRRLARYVRESSEGSTRILFVGMWRSLVAHLTGGQGVAGSNPVIPTTILNKNGPIWKAESALFISSDIL